MGINSLHSSHLTNTFYGNCQSVRLLYNNFVRVASLICASFVKNCGVKKIDFPLICDVLFYTACFWLFALAILRYFRMNLAIAALIAGLIALAVGLTVFLISYGTHRKRTLTKRAREERDALMLHFALEKSERVRAALVEAYCAAGKQAHCSENEITVNGETAIPLFTMQPVSADAVAHLLREHGEKPFVLLCNELSPEAEKLLASFGRKFIKGDEIYTLFSETDTTPSPLICGEIPRKTAKTKLKRAFGKQNARPFFMCGILLLFMSLFTLFPFYYLITGSVLLLCAVSVRLLGYA